jgi:diguanylate cyclase (GGDEF)-like protein
MVTSRTRAWIGGALAIAFLALHLLVVSQRALDPMAWSYAMQVLAPLAAAGVAWWMGRAGERGMRTRWRLVALAFVFWAAGMGTSMCIDVAGACDPEAGIDVAAYVLYGVPLLLVLATPPSEWASPLIRAIDAGMAAVLTALMLVNTFAIAALGTDADQQVLAGYVTVFDAENLLLFLFAAIRLLAAGDAANRALYASLAVYAALYFAVALFYNHHVVVALGIDAGSAYDVLVGVPFLAFMLVALVPDHRLPAVRATPPRLERFAATVPPFFLTVTVVVVAALAARHTFGLGIACTLLAILGYGVRSTLQQVHHIGAARSAERDRDAMANLAWRDALTGIGNRRAFDAALHLEWDRARRTEHSLGLLMIDIDNFKAINDLKGHIAGDEVIRAVGHALESSASLSSDVLARYGGEEFACLLPDTPLRRARITAERMRAAIQALAIAHPAGVEGVVTVSVGVASLVPGETGSVEQLVEVADRALYAAKAAGRNRIAG